MSHYKGSGRVQELLKKVDRKILIPPQALDIIWGNDSRYWRLPRAADQPLELLQVCWLEVTGTCPWSSLTTGVEYKLTFTVSTKPDAFGWTDSPVYLMVKHGSQGPYTWKKADLSQVKDGQQAIPNTTALTFTVPSSPKEQNFTFGLYEIWRGRWKGGLLIHQVTIEPVS